MSAALVKTGKDKHALTAFSQGEQYFVKIPPLLEASKKQGVSASSDLIQRIKLSNAKHKEIGGQLQKDLPQGKNEALDKALNLNQEIKKKIEKL